MIINVFYFVVLCVLSRISWVLLCFTFVPLRVAAYGSIPAKTNSWTRFLEQTLFRKGQGLSGGDDDEVIQHADIDQRQRLFQRAGKQLVGLTGFGYS
jgi:hypothetical protein